MLYFDFRNKWNFGYVKNNIDQESRRLKNKKDRWKNEIIKLIYDRILVYNSMFYVYSFVINYININITLVLIYDCEACQYMLLP